MKNAIMKNATRNPIARNLWKFNKPSTVTSKKLYSRKGKLKWNCQAT